MRCVVPKPQMWPAGHGAEQEALLEPPAPKRPEGHIAALDDVLPAMQ